jgi:hypothetical protein
MAAQKKLTVVRTPVGKLIFIHIEHPDNVAQAGSTWKPDGKYKLTVVVQDLKGLDEAIYAFGRKEFGSNYPGDANLIVPFKPGKRDEDAGDILITAKSAYSPKLYDANVQPTFEFPRVGDKGVVKFSLFPFSKTETVKVNGKNTQETVYGVAARLVAVQVVAKRGDGDADGFEAYGEHDEEEAAPARPQTNKTPASDNTDF